MIVTSPSKPPAEGRPTEVLIPEAREHRRRRRLGIVAKLTAIALVVVALAALGIALLSPSKSGGSTTGADASPTGPPIAQTVGAPFPTLPPGITQLTAISCASSFDCVAIGSGGIGNVSEAAALWTTDGGSTWSRSNIAPGAIELQGVSCIGSTCLAGAGYQLNSGVPLLARSTDGGADWQLAALPGIKVSVDTIACSTATTCVMGAGYHVYRSTDTGSTWHQLPIAGVGTFDSVTCPTALYCAATATTAPVGKAKAGRLELIVTSHNGGRTWSIADRLNASQFLLGVQCVSSLVCAVGDPTAVRGVVVTTADGGATWAYRLLPVAFGSISGVACTTASDCIAWRDGPFGQARQTTTTSNGGATWTSPTMTPDNAAVQAMTCPTPTVCELVGADLLGVVILGSTDAGAHWLVQPLPFGVVRVEGAACATFAACVLATQATRRGAVFQTSDRGTSWSRSSLPSGTSAVMATECISSTFCAAAANGLLISRDGGATWSLDRLALGSQKLDGVACASSSQCVLVGGTQSIRFPSMRGSGDSIVYLWRAGVLHRVQAPGSVEPLSSVSCVGATCVAVGGLRAGYALGPGSYQLSVLVSHDGGATWSSAVVPQAVAGLDAVSCATSLSCVAVGQVMGSVGSEPGILATSDAGRSWTLVPTIHRNAILNEVACTKALSCVAVGPDDWTARGGATREVTYELRVTDGAGRWVSTSLPLRGFYNSVGTVLHQALFGVVAAPGTNRFIVSRIP